MRAGIDVSALSDEDHREFAEAILAFGKMVIETRELARSLSRGDLDVQLPPLDNELAAPLKALHSTLKHLTWQTKQVANGDYEQNIRFMGEFSTAFNEMVAQLAERQQQVEAATERDQLRLSELVRINSIFEAITANMEEWIVMIDRKTGDRLFTNHQAESFLASCMSEQQMYSMLLEYAASISSDDEPRKEEFTLICDTAMQHFEMMLYPIKWMEHDAVVCVLADVTTAKEEFNRMEDAAYRDSLTGGYNRLYGMKTLHHWTDEKIPFSLIFIDLDMLKYVNDVLGHAEGDIYIKFIFSRCRC